MMFLNTIKSTINDRCSRYSLSIEQAINHYMKRFYTILYKRWIIGEIVGKLCRDIEWNKNNNCTTKRSVVHVSTNHCITRQIERGGIFNQTIDYRQTCNVRHTKSEKKKKVSRLVLQLPLPSPLKPIVKSRTEISRSSDDRRYPNHIWVVNYFIAY